MRGGEGIGDEDAEGVEILGELGKTVEVFEAPSTARERVGIVRLGLVAMALSSLRFCAAYALKTSGVANGG